MYIFKLELYLNKEHIQLLKNESEYVKQRYHAIVKAFSSKNNVIREKASHDLEISMRQFRCLLKRFQNKGISGLRNKSKRPFRSPYKTAQWLEDLVV